MKDQQQKYITPQQAAEHLPIGATQVLNYIKKKILKAERSKLDSRKYLIKWEDFLEFREMYFTLNPDKQVDADPESEPEPAGESRKAS